MGTAAPKRVLLVFGTRPEAIKLAPLALALRAAPDFEPVVAVTGQHRQILDQVLTLFGIRPDFDLDIIEPRQTLTSVTTKVLDRLAPLLGQVAPDLVVVQGDTTSTFAGALAAFYQQVPVAHVEAGLRTGDVRAPYPEEMNRRLTSQLTDLHLAPTPSARDNLRHDGCPAERIVVTGNTVIDALLHVVAADGDGVAAAPIGDHDGPVLLVTLHRREAWGDAMAGMAHALADVARAEPSLRVVLPIHPNPVVREKILPVVAALPNVVVVEPLGYVDFVRVMRRSTVVLTDSGGVQEEAPSLGKPVLVARETTERPEAVAAGTARLVGTDRDRIGAEVLRLLRDGAAYTAMATAVNPYGDGQAARRIVQAIRHHGGTGPPPDEFAPGLAYPE